MRVVSTRAFLAATVLAGSVLCSSAWACKDAPLEVPTEQPQSEQYQPGENAPIVLAAREPQASPVVYASLGAGGAFLASGLMYFFLRRRK